MRVQILTTLLLLPIKSAICYAEPLLLSAKDLNRAIDRLPAITQPDPVEELESRCTQLKTQPNSLERRALLHTLNLIHLVRSIKLIPEETNPARELARFDTHPKGDRKQHGGHGKRRLTSEHRTQRGHKITAAVSRGTTENAVPIAQQRSIVRAKDLVTMGFGI